MNSHSIVLPIDSAEASLGLVGGKARSLARLSTAHEIRIPPGFVVSTIAYRRFLEANQLQKPVLALASAVSPDLPDSAAEASTRIESLFEAAAIPPEIATSIGQAYAAMGGGNTAVAVRSSATAEDLPDMSFAGQQESFLNVSGQQRLADSIRRCWASLWTARAITYRAQMGISHQSVAMGVVVQKMVPADIAGILFTANPNSGDREELIVNASFGLGEAIVSGAVTPDTYVIDRKTRAATQTLLGDKALMVNPNGGNGITTQEVPQQKKNTSSLAKDQLSELADLGVKIQDHFDDIPQDIEWALTGNQFWILQSRPITKLPPPPLKDVHWDPPAKGDSPDPATSRREHARTSIATL